MEPQIKTAPAVRQHCDPEPDHRWRVAMDKRNHVCAQCDERFDYERVGTPSRKYCSALCRGRAQGAKRKRQKVQVTSACEQCAEEFTELAYPGRTKRFCSTACYKRFHYLANAELYRQRAAESAARNPERRRMVSAAYREANRDSIIEKQRAHYLANRERIAAANAAYYQAHKAERAAYWQRWYQENPDVAAENVRQWREANPERVKEYKRLHSHRRRAIMYGAGYEPFDPATVFERDGWVCQICDNRILRSRPWPDPMSASLDHIVPIASGGAHTVENTQCSHLRCNMLKSDRDKSGASQRAMGLAS